MSLLRQRVGALAALVVGIAIVVLYVALQPGDRPTQAVVTTTTTTTAAPTTTVDPTTVLCNLAREFQEDSIFQDPNVTARLAEDFYTRAAEVASPEARPEYVAAARYYTEYNNIGEQYGYDFWAIVGSPDGDRWVQLLFREPLGVPIARANVAFICQVELPPPPTVTTTTTTRPRTTRPPATEAPADTAPESPGPPPPPEPPGPPESPGNPPG